jgi:outer membrane PBP1 activator LpoA protein
VRVATWLEERAPLALSEVIGEQFRLGQVDDAAYAHFMAAAEQAVSEGTLERADALFERASSLEVPPSLRAQALLSRAQHALESGDASAAEAQLARAEPWIARSSPEAHADLRAVRARLERELAEARAGAHPPGDSAATSASADSAAAPEPPDPSLT